MDEILVRWKLALINQNLVHMGMDKKRQEKTRKIFDAVVLWVCKCRQKRNAAIAGGSPFLRKPTK